MTEPICKITNLVYLKEMPADGNLQLTIEYDNVGAEGPTFYRTRRPGTWMFKHTADIPNHVPGELHGGHSYVMVPENHLILQVEVGHGTWNNPITITDTALIFVQNPKFPPPKPGETVVVVDILEPPRLWTPALTFWGTPGSTIMAAWVADWREGDRDWLIRYNATVDSGTPIYTDYKLNGEDMPRGEMTLKRGDTHVVEAKSEIPKDFKPRPITYSTYLEAVRPIKEEG